jgi:hypothetical protein
VIANPSLCCAPSGVCSIAENSARWKSPLRAPDLAAEIGQRLEARAFLRPRRAFLFAIRELVRPRRRHFALRRAVEKGVALVELAVGNRIVSVRVTLRAADREPEPHRPGRRRAIHRRLRAVQLQIRACLVVLQRIAVKPVAIFCSSVAPGSRSPASCSIVNRSNGRSRFTASITQSRQRSASGRRVSLR